VMVGPPSAVPPRDRFLSSVSDGRGRYERGLKSALVYRWDFFPALVGTLFFQFRCKSDITIQSLFCHSDGPFLHINIYGGLNELSTSSTWYLDI